MRRAGPWLLLAAIACAIGTWAADRFGYELCHRGVPLAGLALGLPILGAIAGVAALFQRMPRWMMALDAAVVVVSAYQFVLAIILVAGVGIAACG